MATPKFANDTPGNHGDERRGDTGIAVELRSTVGALEHRRDTSKHSGDTFGDSSHGKGYNGRDRQGQRPIWRPRFPDMSRWDSCRVGSRRRP